MARAYDSSHKQALPIGTVAHFAGSPTGLPNGWLLCDGSAVSRTTFSDLFASVGISWGIGDGATTFNLPDCRGRFLRGVNHSSGNDPDPNTRKSFNGGNGGDAAGSYQDQNIVVHHHKFSVQATGTQSGSFASGNSGYNDDALTDRFTTPPGGNETRPVNAGMHFIIRFV